MSYGGNGILTSKKQEKANKSLSNCCAAIIKSSIIITSKSFDFILGQLMIHCTIIINYTQEKLLVYFNQCTMNNIGPYMKSKELDVLRIDDFIIAAQQLLRLLLAFSCFFEVKILSRPYDIRTT